MKTMLSPDDRDDDADDCGAASFSQRHNRNGDPQIPQLNISSSNHSESYPANIPRASTPLLLKSRIHATGVRVVHELARGVPGFWGPPASEVARLYAALEVEL